MYKLFLTLRYLRKRRIAYFAISAVTLCTFMVVVVNSVMGGFLDKLKIKARGLLGDVIVDNGATQGMPEYERFLEEISKWPEIEKATPVLYTLGMMKVGDIARVQKVNVVGIHLQDVYRVNAFKSSLYYNKFYPDLTDLGDRQQPLLGIDPAAPLERFEGDSLIPLLALPDPYRSALERSRQAGIVDRDTVPTQLNELLAERGVRAIPGVFQFAEPSDPRNLPAPQMTGDPFPGLIIGRDLIADRQADGRYLRDEHAPLGCRVVLTLASISDSGSFDPVKVPFRYVDDSRTGIYEIDKEHVYCNFTLLQKYLAMDRATLEDGSVQSARCHQIQIKLAPGADANGVAKKLKERYQAMADDPHVHFADRTLIKMANAVTWEESQRHVIGPVEKERQLVTILFGIVSIVAIALVLCILYMIVLQKTRDIGILKSIGGTSAGVATIFLSYGAAVGIVGSGVGAIGGWLFVHYINNIQDFLVWAFKWQVWSRDVYSFDEIPNTVRPMELLMIVSAGIIASTLGAIGAALRAGAMQPVESLRYE